LADQEHDRSFEDALQELESLVTKLEQGDLPLEESLQDFERGVKLTRTCQQMLREAEQKVKILNSESDDLEPFDPED
jgi:exodeoxyribonuclease VII small subunit